MFDNVKLGTRLAAGFGLLLALLALVVGMAAWQVKQLALEAEAYGDNIVPSLRELNQIAQDLDLLRRLELRHLLTDEAAGMDAIEAEMATTRQALAAALDRYAGQMLVDAEDRAHLDRTRAAVAAYDAYWAGLRPLSRKTADDPATLAEAKRLAAQGRRTFDAAQAAVDGWWKFNMALSDRAKRHAEAAYTTARRAMFGLSALALVLGVAAAWAITRSVQRQIGGEPAYAMAVVGEIAQGNLAVEMRLRSGDDRSLLAAVQSMRDRLRAIVAQVRAGSDGIATGSTQIASGNADLSQRTEEQASNLQQTAAAMEQLAETVQSSAATAGQAKQLAAGAAAAAARGGEAVGRVVHTMDDISSASRRIADILGTIDGIAFQTNILALNAAVEAARAGEAGRGFAVVASEVRTLAQRSAEAAREIKALIVASTDTVETGARQVDEAGRSMGEIVAQVRQVSEMIAELSDTAAAQATGIGQVGNAVQQLDQVTQQNAALVEQSAAAAESLRHQADRMAHAVSAFRLPTGRADDAAPSAPAAPAAPTAPAAVRAEAVSPADGWSRF